MNKAEEFVSQLCTRSFLSLWSFTNPRGKDSGKELCDILVVCEPDIIIFSVKEVQVKNSTTGRTRWYRKSIDASCKQIYGAERWIATASHVITKEGKKGLPFPGASSRRIHRVAVALGGKGEMPLPLSDFSKGFVHVFDEISLQIIMGELDTITDFCKYLTDKESLFQTDIHIIVYGGEEDLLALYLQNNRAFPNNYAEIIVEPGLWRQFAKKQEYQAKKTADRESYVWDRLIETFCQHYRIGDLESGDNLSDAEKAIRIIARENRFSRRLLGKHFIEFLELTRQRKVRSRYFADSISGISYVFLVRPHDEDRKYRIAELQERCFVVRGILCDHTTVVGIATEEYEPNQGYSLDLVCLNKPMWTSEDRAQMENLQQEFGYFRQPIQSNIHEDEYPCKA